MDHAIVLFASEPSLVDERLDDRREEYSCFLLRILLPQGEALGWSLEKKGIERNMPYKYNEPRRGVARPYHELRVWKLAYPGKRRRLRRVLRPFLHALELVWRGQKPKIDLATMKDG